MRPVTLWPRADRQTATVPMIAAPAKVAVFLIALTAIFGVAYLTGTQSSALLAAPPVSAHDQHRSTFGGLSATADGYTIRLPESSGSPGNDQFVELQITGPDGRPVLVGRPQPDTRAVAPDLGVPPRRPGPSRSAGCRLNDQR